MGKTGYIYILASGKRGTPYAGVTSDLVKRVHQHRSGRSGGFAAKYGCDKLVYFEVCDDIETAIAREKAIKKWRRAWKIEMIEANNRAWRDLCPEIIR